MNSRQTQSIIARALREDTAGQDITTRLLVPNNFTAEAVIRAKEDAVVCGLILAQRIFRKISRRLAFRALVKDGQKIKKGTTLASLKGNARAILTGERTALNFLGHLSGIATLTEKFVRQAKPYGVKIFDTRKTTPGLRQMEKFAVRCGGGFNHRMDLHGAMFVKDNHRALYPGHRITNTLLYQLKHKAKKTLILETDTLKQFREALTSGADVILLDNFSAGQIKNAVRLRKKTGKKKPLLEASGGITLNNVRKIAQSGVDRISVGALTHSARSIDVSLDVLVKNKNEE